MRSTRHGSAWVLPVVLAAGATAAGAAGIEVRDTGGKPAERKVIVTSPGVYRAEIWQAAGGGIMKFHNLAADSEAKVNLAGFDRGLFEIGWHGRQFKGPERADCCAMHMLQKAKEGKPKKAGEMCYDGCADWPSIGHRTLHAEGTLEVVEKSPARVRVRAAAPLVWWSKHVHKLQVTATYTFYVTGRIAIQVRVRNTGGRPFHWSSEYGPHLFLPSGKKPGAPPDFIFGTPKFADWTAGGGRSQRASQELALAYHPKRKSSLLLTIPAEAHKTFTRHMRHTFKGNWDRYGYGSSNVVMGLGYDERWACMIQLGSAAGGAAPAIRTPADALPYASQYRRPAKLTGAVPVTDDAGDLNADGYNESEGCFVLKGPGPLALTYERGRGAGFAPAFKVIGWKSDAPRSVTIEGKPAKAVAAVVDGVLILQVLARVEAAAAKIRIGG